MNINVKEKIKTLEQERKIKDAHVFTKLIIILFIACPTITWILSSLFDSKIITEIFNLSVILMAVPFLFLQTIYFYGVEITKKTKKKKIIRFFLKVSLFLVSNLWVSNFVFNNYIKFEYFNKEVAIIISGIILFILLLNIGIFVKIVRNKKDFIIIERKIKEINCI